ncbi:MAG: hypothetical protein AAGL90_15715 [Pseudomonadota bacterium]
MRYIKLGPNNLWFEDCLANDRIDFGHHVVPHEAALTGDWDAVRAVWSAGTSPAKASDFLREVKDFYSQGSDCLWITFAQGRLWWAFAEADVILHDQPNEGAASRYRRVIGSWRSSDRFGHSLVISDISSKLTKTAAYRQTLCRVQAEDYAVRLINGEEDPAVIHARAAKGAFVEALLPIIQSLHETDFEVLTDLLFNRLGWVRVSALGGLQKDTDLILEQPATKARAFVQVKSAADQSVLDDYAMRFADMQADTSFFICHSPRGELVANDNMHVWTGPELAERVVHAGLVDWVLTRAA